MQECEVSVPFVFIFFTALYFLKNADDVCQDEEPSVYKQGERKNTHFIHPFMEMLFTSFLHLCQSLHFSSPKRFSTNSLCLV